MLIGIAIAVYCLFLPLAIWILCCPRQQDKPSPAATPSSTTGFEPAVLRSLERIELELARALRRLEARACPHSHTEGNHGQAQGSESGAGAQGP